MFCLKSLYQQDNNGLTGQHLAVAWVWMNLKGEGTAAVTDGIFQFIESAAIESDWGRV